MKMSSSILQHPLSNSVWMIACFVLLVSVCKLPPVSAITGGKNHILMDSSGSLRLKIPSIPTSKGVVSIITSPGTTSFFTTQDDILSLEEGDDLGTTSTATLICRGATLKGTSAAERSALATTSLVSDAMVVDGITAGDVEAAGWRNTRHSRSMTALFRSRLAMAGDNRRQLLILCIKNAPSSPSLEATLQKEVRTLFEATAAETKENISFDDLYDVKVVSVTTEVEAEETLAMAKEMAAELAQSSDASSFLASALQEANERIKDSGIAAVALDPPHIAHAFVAVSNANAKQSKSARAKIATWKSRAARGLWVEGFGADAEATRKRLLASFDSETLAAAGLPLVAPYRLEMRTQLASMVDASIGELFAMQVGNVKASTMKRFRAQLLKKLDVTPAEEVPSENAAAIRAAMFSFDNIVSDLEVPSLSLTKTKPCRDMEALLTDEVMTFPDSPAAKIKRTKHVAQVTKKEKKPGQRSVDLGLDLVAVLRPDGYGSFQGFAGYQLGGNSITIGVHNDADDPSTIAQFGGVRPPLLRIQPKLRVDVEM